jgi:fatty acid synthase
MAVLLKSVIIQAIYLDALMLTECEEKVELEKLMAEYIQAGIVKPLPFTCFEHDELEGAFRFLASGKHIGKVLLKIRDGVSAQKLIQALPKTYFYKDKTYIVVGGLGGMGLEITDWMIERGAREIFIVSRSGIRNSYQESMLEKWREIGACIHLETINVSSMNQVCTLLLDAISIAPIGGIFNLSLVLEDAFFQNQTCTKFETVCSAKATAMKYFDALSRQLAPYIDHFVVFSSIVTNRGNQGQSNYGYANSVMERICENRKSEGLPGLGIQWGFVGDVGYTAVVFKGKGSIMGLKPQSIKSCIETLDLLLQQDRTVVSSIMVAGHQAKTLVGQKEASLADTVARILGVNNLAKVDLNATLTEMGMDSIMATELKHALNKKWNIILPSQAYGKLTFKSLLDME